MKVWYCGHRQAAFKDAAGQCPRFENPRADASYGCREMQLVPADARIVTSSDPELRETIIGLMTSRDWYDWPTDEQYLQECVTEALDGLGKTADV